MRKRVIQTTRNIETRSVLDRSIVFDTILLWSIVLEVLYCIAFVLDRSIV